MEDTIPCLPPSLQKWLGLRKLGVSQTVRNIWMGFSCGRETNCNILKSIPVSVSYFTFVCSVPEGHWVTPKWVHSHNSFPLALLFGWSHIIFWDAQHTLPTWTINGTMNSCLFLTTLTGWHFILLSLQPTKQRLGYNGFFYSFQYPDGISGLCMIYGRWLNYFDYLTCPFNHNFTG